MKNLEAKLEKALAAATSVLNELLDAESPAAEADKKIRRDLIVDARDNILQIQLMRSNFRKLSPAATEEKTPAVKTSEIWDDATDALEAPAPVKTLTDPFWDNVDDALDTLERDKPDTAGGVISLLNEYFEKSAGDAFFAGSGGDRQLLESLEVAGWEVYWSEASYYYVARHATTWEVLTYIEGDVYKGARVG